MEEGKTKEVMRGALLLTIAGIISKVLSATYRIPLQNLTGDLGFYMYQQVYPLIGITMMIGLYGFPVAVSKIVAERKALGKVNSLPIVYGPLFIILFLMGLLIAIPLFVFAPQITSWLDTPQLMHAFRLASGLFLTMPLLALLRGGFQGHDKMAPTAYSQIAEQLIRVIIIITAAYFVYIQQIDVYQIGSAGIFASLLSISLVITFWLVLFRPNTKRVTITTERIPWRYYIKTCFALGVIAALSHLILILLQLVDVLTIVPHLIASGLPAIEAMKWKGVFDRGQPLIQFGIVFGSSFALALIPAVVREARERILAIREAISFSFYLSAAATIGLIFMMPEVNVLLYLNTIGTGSMQILAFAIILTATGITASSILQSMGDVWYVAIWILLAVIIKYILNIVLVPMFAINGSAVATIVSLLVVAISVLYRLHRRLPTLRFLSSVRWSALLLAIISMVTFILLAKYLFLIYIDVSRLGLLLYVGIVVGIGAFIYITVLLYFQVLTERQLQAIPFSQVLLYIKKGLKK